MIVNRDAAADARVYRVGGDEQRAEIDRAWSDVIYYCPECDDARVEDCATCPRFPAEHDESGFLGTGTEYHESIRRLAKAMVRFS